MNKKRFLFIAPALLFTITALGGCSSSDTATVKFNTDGGTAIADVQVKKGEKVTRPATDPSKDGYNFINWFDAPQSSAEANLFNFDKAITTDTTIYAHYTAVSIDFDIDPSMVVTIKKGEEKEFKIVFKDSRCLVGSITWKIDTTILEKVSESQDHKTIKVKGIKATTKTDPTDVEVIVKNKVSSEERTHNCNVYVEE